MNIQRVILPALKRWHNRKNSNLQLLSPRITVPHRFPHCGLDFLLTISFDLGSSYKVSTHKHFSCSCSGLAYSLNLAFPDLAMFSFKYFYLKLLTFYSPLPYHSAHDGINSYWGLMWSSRYHENYLVSIVILLTLLFEVF